MRIISQDGCYDLPYEQTMLTNIGTKIYADNLAVKELRFAEYSTEEKAEKAMKMCVENYADCNFSKGAISTLANVAIGTNLITEDDLEQIKATIAGRFFFKFPTDEEVE